MENTERQPEEHGHKGLSGRNARKENNDSNADGQGNSMPHEGDIGISTETGDHPAETGNEMSPKQQDSHTRKSCGENEDDSSAGNLPEESN